MLIQSRFFLAQVRFMRLAIGRHECETRTAVPPVVGYGRWVSRVPAGGLWPTLARPFPPATPVTPTNIRTFETKSSLLLTDSP